jgi:putative ABC transport system permease protein
MGRLSGGSRNPEKRCLDPGLRRLDERTGSNVDEIFGLDMNYIMAAVLIDFALIVGGVGAVALFGRIILKVGLRNIPRRPAQTLLIVVGLMLSTLIVSSALGTGDTINHSNRNDVIKGLGEIDELLTANQGRSLGLTGSNPYFPL